MCLCVCVVAWGGEFVYGCVCGVCVYLCVDGWVCSLRYRTINKNLFSRAAKVQATISFICDFLAVILHVIVGVIFRGQKMRF